MKKLFVALGILGVGCNPSPQTGTAPPQGKDTLLPSASLSLTPEQLLADSSGIHFTDKGSFWMMYFSNGQACMDYYPQCGSCFKADIHRQKIRMYWNTSISGKPCVDLTTRFKNVESPQTGKPFAELQLMDDNHFMILYYFQNWVDSMNAKESPYIDTLFPRSFEKMD